MGEEFLTVCVGRVDDKQLRKRHARGTSVTTHTTPPPRNLPTGSHKVFWKYQREIFQGWPMGFVTGLPEQIARCIRERDILKQAGHTGG